MANVKRVEIDAVVPFNYLERLRDKERAILADWFLAPSWGVRHAWEPVGFVPNDHGGQTAMYRLTIRGEEAVSFAAFDILMATLRKAGGVVRAECADLETGATVWPVRTYDAYDQHGHKVRVTVPESER